MHRALPQWQDRILWSTVQHRLDAMMQALYFMEFKRWKDPFHPVMHDDGETAIRTFNDYAAWFILHNIPVHRAEDGTLYVLYQEVSSFVVAEDDERELKEINMLTADWAVKRASRSKDALADQIQARIEALEEKTGLEIETNGNKRHKFSGVV